MDDDELDDYELETLEFERDDDPWEDAMMNCGLVGNTGLCTMAGSEYCDWDCPFAR